jgi:predicted site-specific integrase-resolvase
MEKLAVSIDTVKRMEERGQLRPIRFNSRLIRYRLVEVDEMMKRHEAEVGSE